jgi:5'-AMP-activated protein kinase regulatory beta subunit
MVLTSGSWGVTDRIRCLPNIRKTRFSGEQLIDQLTPRYSKSPNADAVYLAGTMTAWQSVRMTKPAGETHWVQILEAREATHHYKFLVDGHWCIEETVPTVSDEAGTKWNVIQVRKSDFEVFEALACDSFTLKNSEHEKEARRFRTETWSQVSPDFKKMDIRQQTPPTLPPHLLQVILNRDVSYLPDPILLEEPSHVMLNHFYAQVLLAGMPPTHHRVRKRTT